MGDTVVWAAWIWDTDLMKLTRAHNLSAQLLAERKKKAKIIAAVLGRLFPRGRIALRYKNSWELLVAVVLSAQCTDNKVNEVTGRLFKKYLTIADYLRARPAEFERDIYETGFYRTKAKNILAAARIVKEKFNDQVPGTMAELVTIPGVGRKTANVILATAFGSAEGIAVDTHVRRLARLHGLTSNTNPDKIEQDLMKIFPRSEWKRITFRFIEYGRKYCPARKHVHSECPLTIALKKLS